MLAHTLLYHELSIVGISGFVDLCIFNFLHIHRKCQISIIIHSHFNPYKKTLEFGSMFFEDRLTWYRLGWLILFTRDLNKQKAHSMKTITSNHSRFSMKMSSCTVLNRSKAFMPMVVSPWFVMESCNKH